MERQSTFKPRQQKAKKMDEPQRTILSNVFVQIHAGRYSDKTIFVTTHLKNCFISWFKGIQGVSFTFKCDTIKPKEKTREGKNFKRV